MTSAAETKFCAEKVGTDDLYLWVDGNQKISVDGSFGSPRPNALSLVQVDDCPYSTGICRSSCYVQGLEKFASETHALYRHNSKVLREVLSPGVRKNNRAHIGDFRATQLMLSLVNWINDNCTGFRWHVSGDVFSEDYAYWISLTCALTPSVYHWIYTRSLPYVGTLLVPRNLAVNISCDAENYAEVRSYYDALVSAGSRLPRLCYLSHDGFVPCDLPPKSVVFPDYSLRGDKQWRARVQRKKVLVCPVDFLGKSERRRCSLCARCLFSPGEVPRSSGFVAR